MNLMTKTTAIELKPLPYPENALAPTISARTMGLHYGKHHRGYVEKLNAFIEGTDFAGKDLEEIVQASFGDPQREVIFDNAAQAWNHEFLWNLLSPAGGTPEGDLAIAINRDFGSYNDFLEKFVGAGVQHFGSGWVWLVVKDNVLSVETTANAMTPMARGETCLLCADLWEHAYYLDYQNQRLEHLTSVTVNLLNWDFAAQNFTSG